MDIHFHYYAIRALAHCAGFDGKEAEIIAYASQYVDDATEHGGFKIKGIPPEADDQHIAGLFEPVCTAHAGLQYVVGLRTDVQRKVYIPFHFLPPELSRSSRRKFDYRVKAGSPHAHALLDEAIAAVKGATSGTPRIRALIKTGIALHTFADTWAHEGFSGRWSAADNDIQDRSVFRSGQWDDLGFFERMFMDASPDIGHIEAGVLPDCSELTWRCRHEGTSKAVARNNTDHFTKAAAAILTALSGKKPNPVCLDKVRKCLGDRGKASSRKLWKQQFPRVFDAVDYDRLRWRREALAGSKASDLDWMGKDEHYFAGLSCKARGDLKWFLFHVEAGIQRDNVLRRVPLDLS